MKGPVDTVSIPVPLHVGHRSGRDPGSLPVPLHLLHVSMMLTYMSCDDKIVCFTNKITKECDTLKLYLVHPAGSLLECQVDVILLGPEVELLCLLPACEV